METEKANDILGKAARDGSMDYSVWPELLPTVLDRIEKIAHTEFPIPNVPAPQQPVRPPSPRFLAPLPSSDPFEAPEPTEPSSSQGTNKENADPSLPTAARTAGSNPNQPQTSSAPASTADQQQASRSVPLPKPIADMLDEILSVLRTDFSQYPPHTIQRLSELVLYPRQHYRNLVPYLHALDRVVHVTSGANTYPLPPALPDIGAMSLLANGVGGGGAGSLSIDTAAANSLGSDEALGGALLTPIPWLARTANGGGSDDGSDAGSSSPLSASGNPAQQFQLRQQQQQQRQGSQLEGRVRTESTETIEGPNGMGSIETVSVSVNGIPSTGAGVALLTQRSVTQGELLRQEQRAGLVPLNQLNRQQQQQQQREHTQEDATMSEDASKEDEEEEIPHARGPQEIGPADTGPQDPATANYIAGGGSGGPVIGVQGIDVEAAVGRRVQSPPAQQQQQERTKRVSGSPEGGEIIPQSPKREADDDLEPESPAKRRREDEPGASAGSSAGQEQNLVQRGAKQQSADGTAPSEDAEGDVVLPDATTDSTSKAPAATSKSTTAGESTAQIDKEHGAKQDASEDDKQDSKEPESEAEQQDKPAAAAPDSTATITGTGADPSPASTAENKGG